MTKQPELQPLLAPLLSRNTDRLRQALADRFAASQYERREQIIGDAYVEAFMKVRISDIVWNQFPDWGDDD